MRLSLSVCLIAACLVAHHPEAAEPVDRVVAVVGEIPLLESELNAEAEAYAADPSFEGIAPDEARRFVLEKLIEDRVFLAKANKEGIEPSEEEIEEALESTIDRMRDRFPGREEFLAALEAEGVTEEELRSRYRREVERTLSVRMLVEGAIRGKSEVSEADLRRFYNEHIDDLPVMPERFSLAQIFFEPKTDASSESTTVRELLELRSRTEAGEDFAALARENSDGPSAPAGGDLGFFGRGEMDTAFEEAAFALEKPGDLSGVVRSRFGMHLIEMTEREGERIRVRHILKTATAGKAGWEEAFRHAESVAESLGRGVDFALLAQEHSSEEQSAAAGGELGIFAFDDMTEEVRSVLENMEPGDASGIVEAVDGYHIFKVLARFPEGKPGFEETREELRGAVRQQKQQNAYREYLEELREEIYVEVLE